MPPLRALLWSMLLVALVRPPYCAANDAVQTGYASLVRRVAPSVVTVMVEEKRVSAGQRAAERANPEAGADAVSELIRRLLSGASGNRSADERAAAALGSGFVIRADGYIVTNRHVIADARLIHVRPTDGRELPATIVGADALTDIALLKVGADHLPVLKLGSSSAVSVGDRRPVMSRPKP